MTQTFHGDWSIEVFAVNADFAQRFTIAGSTGSDGHYPGTVGTGIARVSGSEWRLTMEWNDNVNPAWSPSDIRRSASYSLEKGMLVFLGADDNVPALRDHDYDDFIVLCRYLDPAVNPPPTPNPFDFTIPEAILVPPK